MYSGFFFTHAVGLSSLHFPHLVAFKKHYTYLSVTFGPPIRQFGAKIRETNTTGRKRILLRFITTNYRNGRRIKLFTVLVVGLPAVSAWDGRIS